MIDFSLNGEEALFVPGQGDDLVVVFSAINFKSGSFGFFKFFDSYAGHKLFLNSPGNKWYQRDVDGINRILDCVVQQYAVCRIFYYGSSMGAYGALLFSLLRKDGACLAYGPNVILGLEGAHSSRYDISFDDRFLDLSKMSLEVEFPINVWFGAYDLVDAYYYDYFFGALSGLGNGRGFYNIRLVDSCHAFHQHFYNLGVLDLIRDSFLKYGFVQPCLEYVALVPSVVKSKVSNYGFWRSFIRGEKVDAECVVVNDVGDAFCKARILQKNGLHASAVEVIDAAIFEIQGSLVKVSLPEEYRLKFLFLRAESLRRTNDSRAKDDYRVLYDAGFKRGFVSRFL